MKRTAANAFPPTISVAIPADETLSTTTTQAPDAPRASNAIATYDPAIVSKIREAAQLLFKGSCPQFNDDLVFETLLSCHLKDILNLRLVSVGCYHLASTINSYFPYLPLLATKIAIPFNYQNLHPKIERAQQEKLEFARKSTQIEINISLTDLIKAFNDPSSILHSIPEPSLNLALKIESIDEANYLNTLLCAPLTQGNIKLINKISAIDLTKIDITLNTVNSINALLITLSQSSTLIPKLTALSLGNIGIPRQNNSGMILSIPEKLNSLQSFECGTIYVNATLTLPEQLNFLRSFVCQKIEGTLTLPKQLNSLCSFVCGTIFSVATLTLPKQINSLSSFVCGTIHYQATLTLPKQLNSLSSFVCGDILDGATLTLPKQLNSLSSFVCEDIGDGATLTFPEQLNALYYFVCGHLEQRATLTLPEQLNALGSFTCGNIDEDATLTLPKQLNSLRSFECGDIYTRTLFTFPSSLPNLKTLSFGSIMENVAFEFPYSLPKLETLFFKEISSNRPIILSRCFGSLTNFTIGRIGSNISLELPDSLWNIATLTINKIENNASLYLPNSLSPKTTLQITEIGDNVKIKLPQTFRYKNLTAETVGNNVSLSYHEPYTHSHF